MAIWLLLGFVLGTAFVAVANVCDERRVPAIGLILAAAIYLGFAIGADAPWTWLALELAGIGVYGSFAWLGLRYSRWWLAAGWAAHPSWDIGLHLLGDGRELAPVWYALACVSFDLVVALCLLVRCWRRSSASSAADSAARWCRAPRRGPR